MELYDSYIQSQIISLQSRSKELQWLIDQQITAKRIANFGCHIGAETLALMYIFSANEAIGIDKDDMAINQARTTFNNLQDTVRNIWQNLRYIQNYADHIDEQWWYNEVPDFIKKVIIQPDFQVSYMTHDFTQPTSLMSDYYDLSYCDFVLHHIWYDEGRINPRRDTYSAICEMTRVIKPTGRIAVSELIQYNDMPILNFKELFEQAGLKVIFEKVTPVDNEIRKGTFADYICLKLSP